VTREGFEIHFGVNHLGHFKLTKLLLPALVSAPPARIVNVASKAHYDARDFDLGDVFGVTKTFTGLREYERSKLANVLFTRALAERLDPRLVTVYAVHPGVVRSDAWRRIPWPVRVWMTRDMLSNEEGAKTTVHCATSDAVADETGLYYDDCKVKAPSALALDAALADRVWTRSLELAC
jgi:NAD(P)-dependent dehydrogenase (short-subunit alcohol dehydrogenase family)